VIDQWSDGVMQHWSDGVVVSWGVEVLRVMGTKRKNKNRGYQRLRVWQDAITLYKETCRLFGTGPFEMKRIAGQAMASVDSVHRDIAEGYCRRSIREYIQYLYIAVGSLGESVSGYHAYSRAGQLAEEDLKCLINWHSSSKTACSV
jgi:four helix bundle protein